MARNTAFVIKQEADKKTEEVRREAREMIAKKDISAEEARHAAEMKIKQIQDEAERKCKVLRERHNEHEVLLGKLMAVSDTQSARLKHHEKVFDEQEEMIKNIVQYTGEKLEDFEMNTNRLSQNNISLDNKIERKLENVEAKIDELDKKSSEYCNSHLKFKSEIHKIQLFCSFLPFLGSPLL